MIEAILELPNIVLIVLLISAFVVAFKLMEMVLETIMVSVLSGLFYLGLVYLLDYPMALDRVLLFSFLGSSFYMAYSFLASAYSIFSKIIGIPFKLLNTTFQYVVGAISQGNEEAKLKKKFKRYTEKAELFTDKMQARAERSAQERKEENKDVKEVVLDKVKEDED